MGTSEVSRFEVPNCANCPMLAERNGYDWCQHPHGEREIEWGGMELPPWCPLRAAPMVLGLYNTTKQGDDVYPDNRKDSNDDG